MCHFETFNTSFLFRMWQLLSGKIQFGCQHCLTFVTKDSYLGQHS